MELTAKSTGNGGISLYVPKSAGIGVGDKIEIPAFSASSNTKEPYLTREEIIDLIREVIENYQK